MSLGYSDMSGPEIDERTREVVWNGLLVRREYEDVPVLVRVKYPEHLQSWLDEVAEPEEFQLLTLEQQAAVAMALDDKSEYLVRALVEEFRDAIDAALDEDGKAVTE